MNVFDRVTDLSLGSDTLNLHVSADDLAIETDQEGSVVGFDAEEDVLILTLDADDFNEDAEIDVIQLDDRHFMIQVDGTDVPTRIHTEAGLTPEDISVVFE